MTFSGNTELLEWEMDQNGDEFEMENEEHSWVKPDDAQSFEDDLDDPSPSQLRSAPHNWRKHREFLSPVEGAHEEGKLEEDEDIEDLVNGDISLQKLPKTNAPERRSSLEEQQNHLSGGNKFQAMDERFGDETYYYDEDLTTGSNPNTEYRSETQSQSDLIFRNPTEPQSSPFSKYMRYFLMALLALGAGCLLGYLIAKASNIAHNEDYETTQMTTNVSATTATTTIISTSTSLHPPA